MTNNTIFLLSQSKLDFEHSTFFALAAYATVVISDPNWGPTTIHPHTMFSADTEPIDIDFLYLHPISNSIIVKEALIS